MGYLGNQLCGAATETTLVSRNLSNYFLGDIIKKKKIPKRKKFVRYKKNYSNRKNIQLTLESSMSSSNTSSSSASLKTTSPRFFRLSKQEYY